MDQLIEGYRRFRAEVWPAARARYQALAERGQSPETLIIACSDSRVDPATVFNAAPGELFVVRNVAGLVPPFQPDAHYHGTSAALEFGVRVLKVKRIVVLGHARCGGVRTIVEGAPAEAKDFVEPWMGLARSFLAPPVSGDPEEVLAQRETEVVRVSLANLRTFPWIAEAEAAGTLLVVGYQFDIYSGRLARLADTGFVPV